MKRTTASVALVLAAACGVSTQQEVQMGQQYAQQINAQLPIVSDPEVNRYINVMGDSIARLSDDRSLDWHFYIVDSKEVNAFAVPGGFVYVNRGLIERADNMSELAGVLAHEIGHVTQRHSIKQMEKAQTANIGVTLGCILLRACTDQLSQTAINVAGGALFARFSRQDENEADEKGVEYTVRANISPRGMPSMFEKLLEERKRRPAGVEAWFATHPMEEDRIAHVNALIARIDPAILQTLSVDSRNFQTFKQRLMSLPPSPPSKAGD
jgi:predicted Zn-dependent protease